MKFSEKVHNLLKEKHMNMDGLAKKSGINPDRVVLYANGFVEPRIDILMNFAKAFKISVDELVKDTEQEKIWNNKKEQLENETKRIKKTFKGLFN